MCVSEGCSYSAQSFGCLQVLVWRMLPVSPGLCEHLGFPPLRGWQVGTAKCVLSALLGCSPSASQRWEHGDLAPHFCPLVLLIAWELIQKQEATHIAGQETCELCQSCSKASVKGFHM